MTARRRSAAPVRQNIYYWAPPTSPPAKLLLRVEEAADLLGLSRTRVFELIGAGQLESVKVGGSRRVPRAAVEAFVAGLQWEGTAQRRAAR